ncbi:amidase [Telmatospirillum siberiense]|uniref:Amidase n=1 Tax=Telmatospirillum siberiense TaxID=382514 RepID=A0A2N3PTP6_9PROT|nr:amidase [Telmatospirillum siberiense]PKU23774.1 amidase [Telmatospirillum siberiense]
MESDPCLRPAVETLSEIRAGHLSARELMAAHLERISQINPRLNAIVTLEADKAMENAAAADERQARGEDLGPLHGLPIAHKDSFQTRDLRTTFGSKLFADFIPNVDSLVVARAKAAGAICVGKTNLPEFGAGSHTFNALFGYSRNPYDISRTPGGSSGGSAIALATGMTALADGSDMGGSLRNPAGYCNVVGLRPSIGRVPQWPSANAFSTLTVAGPMGRTVADTALLLSVQAGADPRDPLSVPGDGALFRTSLDGDTKGLRIAISPDLGGLPMDPEIRSITAASAGLFEDLGCVVEEATPDLGEANSAFQALRGLAFATGYGSTLERHRDMLKETVIWNIELGLALTGRRVAEAEAARLQAFHRMRNFLETHDFLVAPVSQVPPFPVEEEYVRAIDGTDMETYIDWMKSCYHISITGHPAISVPFAFTAGGLPVGIQIVGKYRDELGLLKLAQAVESVRQCWKRHPICS